MGVVPLHPSDEVLSAYADGETDAAETGHVRRHLQSCAGCSERLAAFTALEADLAGAGSLACEAVRPLLSAELDDELERDLVPLAREHLASCASCQAERTAWESLQAELKATPLAYPSERVDRAIAAVVERRRPAPLALPHLGRAALVRVAAAVAFVAVVAGSLLPVPLPEQAGVPREEQVVVAAMQTVVLNPATNTLYVLRPEEGVVLVRHASDDSVIARVAVGGRPTALALNTETNSVYVLDSAKKSITEIDAKNAVVATVPLPVQGTPTSLQVDPESKKLVVAATASATSGSGEIARIDPASRRLETVRSVDVRPSLVVMDATTNLTFVLSPKATLVLDSATYGEVASLPGGAVDAASQKGVTAILGAEGAGSRVRFYGANASEIELPGKPLAIVPAGEGQFAALLDVGGQSRVVLVGLQGAIDSRDLPVAARRISYDPTSKRFAVIAPSGDALASLSFGAVAAPGASQPQARTTPDATASPIPAVRDGPGASPAPGATRATPGTPASPDASRATPSQPRAGTPAVAAVPDVAGPRLPSAARQLWPSAYFLELKGSARPVAVAGQGHRLWFVDEGGAVRLLDTQSGLHVKIADLPHGATASHFALGGSTLYVLDSAEEILYVVNPVTGIVEPVRVPFAKKAVGLTVATNGHVWFASSSAGYLVDFDPATRASRLVDVGRRGLAGVAADIAGRVWYAANLGGRVAVLGTYDIFSGHIIEYELPRIPAVQALFVDRAGSVWVSTAEGPWLAVRDNELQALYIGPGGRQTFALGPDGRAWLLRIGESGAKVGPAAHPHLAANLPSSTNGLFVDNSGHAWVADAGSAGFYVLTHGGGRPE